LADDQAILDRWKEYFEELLNPTSASPPIPELHSRAMTSLEPDEVRRAIKRLKSGKAAGVDEIRPELLKALGGEGIDWLTRVFQVAWDSGEAPADWQTGVVIPREIGLLADQGRDGRTRVTRLYGELALTH